MKLILPIMTAVSALLMNKDDVGAGTGDGIAPVLRTRQPMQVSAEDKEQRLRQARAAVEHLRAEEDRKALQEGREPNPTPTLEEILATAVDDEETPEPPAPAPAPEPPAPAPAPEPPAPQ